MSEANELATVEEVLTNFKSFMSLYRCDNVTLQIKEKGLTFVDNCTILYAYCNFNGKREFKSYNTDDDFNDVEYLKGKLYPRLAEKVDISYKYNKLVCEIIIKGGE